jgi:hypothetical protein
MANLLNYRSVSTQKCHYIIKIATNCVFYGFRQLAYSRILAPISYISEVKVVWWTFNLFIAFGSDMGIYLCGFYRRMALYILNVADICTSF